MGNAHPNHALANSNQTKGGNSSSPPQSEHGGDGGDDEEKSVLQVKHKDLPTAWNETSILEVVEQHPGCCRQS